jgi:hypothetical protein
MTQTKEQIPEDAKKRIVFFQLNQGKKVLLPCDIAHQIRELLEKNVVKGTGWSYTLGDLE